MRSALEFIKEKNFLFQPTFDRRLKRFDRNGKLEAGWAIGKVIKVPSGEVQHLCFGDFATSERYNWYSRKVASKEDQAAIDAAIAADARAYQEEKNAKQEAARNRVVGIWDSLEAIRLVSLPPYALAKGLSDLHGAKANANGEICVPMRDVRGVLWNLQRVSLLEKGFFKGGKILGNFFQMGEITQEGRIYVCEGYATGVSIFEALGTLKTRGVRLKAGLKTFGDLLNEYEPPGFGLANVDLKQPRTVGCEILQVRASRRPLAPAPDADLTSNGHARRPGAGSGAVVNGVAKHAGRPEGAGSQVLNEPTRGNGHAGGSAAPNTLDRLGPDAPTRGQELPHEQDSAQASSRDRDRARRRSELEWNPSKRETGPVGLQPARLPRDGHEGQALRTPGPSVCVAFNTANLAPVVKSLKEAYPRAEIVICGDDDVWGQAVKGDAPKNAGREQAHKVARTYGCKVVFPRFDHVPDAARYKPTDFNDMACLLGLQSVGLEIEEQLKTAKLLSGDKADKPLKAPVVAPLPVGPEHLGHQGELGQKDDLAPFDERDGHTPAHTLPEKGELISDIGTELCGVNARGTLIMPPHQQVADRLIEVYGRRLIKQDRDLFAYVSTHWKHLSLGDMDKIKQQIQTLCGGLAKARDIEGIWHLFVMHLRAVPEGRNMFTPDPWCANFLNGTLKVIRTSQGYHSTFHVHSSNDYLVNVLPLNYPESRLNEGGEALAHGSITGLGLEEHIHDARLNNTESDQLGEFEGGAGFKVLAANAVFEDMLDRVFAGDADAAEKRRAVAQMYGACLLPAFAHLFMLYGPPGTGKSTVIKIAARLVHDDNVCSVEPHDFGGFNLESMAGKLVNMDTDITTNQPIHDSVVKKIEDRRPFRIRRKGVKDIYAPLPSIHIFGGNSIPPTLEGSSRAHDRRWTFIGFDKVLIGGDYDLDYAEMCFNAGPDGILAFALSGLTDLLQSKGHFFNPTSGKAKMESWQMSNDVVGRFLDDMRAGEILDDKSVLREVKEGQIERPKLYGSFSIWCHNMAGTRHVLSANKFYERMSELGFKQKKTTQHRYFTGLMMGPRTGAHF